MIEGAGKTLQKIISKSVIEEALIFNIFFSLLYSQPITISNVHTLKDIKNKRVARFTKVNIPPGHRLGSICESELEKALHSSIKTASDIANNYKDLQDIYLERVKDFNRICSGLNNKFSRLNTTNTELEAKYTAEIQSLKSKIKTLKREGTLAQKASSADKIKILSLEAKVHELEGKLDDLKLEQVLHDLNAVGEIIDDLAQINSSDSKEIDSLKLELEQANEDLNSKKYEIACMEKEIETSNSIFRRKIDALYSARSKLRKENSSLRDQLALKKELRSASHNEIDTPLPPMNDLSQPSTLNPSSQIISVDGTKAVPLLATAPIIASSLISPLITYTILTLLLIAIIWIVVRKKI